MSAPIRVGYMQQPHRIDIVMCINDDDDDDDDDDDVLMNMHVLGCYCCCTCAVERSVHLLVNEKEDAEKKKERKLSAASEELIRSQATQVIQSE